MVSTREMNAKRFYLWILACIKVVLLKIPFMNRSFVVLSSGRSGSTLLTQLLNCHNEISCRGELLNREELHKHGLEINDKKCLINYILAKLLPAKFWFRYTGFKIFNEQLEFCKLSLQQLLCSLYHPPVIVLYRENLLETFVSLKIAFQNDVWYSENLINQCSIEVDWDEFEQYVETERMRWRESMFCLVSVRKIFVSFEELTTKQSKVMSSVFSFLKVEDCSVTAASKRQNPLALEKKVINYHSIMDKVKALNFPIYLTSKWLSEMC